MTDMVYAQTEHDSVTDEQKPSVTDMVYAQAEHVPVIDEQTPEDFMAIDGTAEFHVSVIAGTEPLTYQWMKDGVPLSDGDKMQGATTSTLTIEGLEFSEVGNYSVQVNNSAGTSISREAALEIRGYFPLNGVPGDGKVTLNWEPVEGSDGMYGIFVNGIPSKAVNNETSCEITGLDNGVPYIFLVVTTVDDGNFNMSKNSDIVCVTPNSYSIEEIGSQTMDQLEEGYASGTQTPRSVTISNTGTGRLESLSVALGGGEDSSFEITQPLTKRLNSSAATTFEIKAKDGLAAGTYTETVTISADNMVPVTFQVTQAVDSGTPQVPGDWVPVGNERFSAGSAFYVSSYIHNGTPYVAYMDETVDNRATVIKYDGSDWVNVGIPGFSAASAIFLSLCVDNGTPYVAYADGGNDGKATVMKYEEGSEGGIWEPVGNEGFS